MRFALFFLALLFALPAYAQQADEIIVEKSKRIMTLYDHGTKLKRYSIALSKNSFGHKTMEGDLKTPEGYYTISGRKEDSDFHRALLISYPDEFDSANANKLGVEPGGRIMIHGRPKDFGKRKRPRDWTWGCISVTNREIEEIWNLVPDGALIEIRP